MNVIFNAYNRQTGLLIDTFAVWNDGEVGQEWAAVIAEAFNLRVWFNGLPITNYDCWFMPS